MATTNEASQAQVDSANDRTDTERLEATVRELQQECNRLRQALINAEKERTAYRHLFLEQARAAREFEDLDIPTLEAMSAGPVEEMD